MPQPADENPAFVI